MPITIVRSPLPKGLSYPLKTSSLEKAVLGVDCDVRLMFFNWPLKGAAPSLLRCHHGAPGQFDVVTGFVKSTERHRAGILLQEQVLPAFVDWMVKVQALPANSTRWMRCPCPFFTADYEEGLVSIRRDDGLGA